MKALVYTVLYVSIFVNAVIKAFLNIRKEKKDKEESEKE